MMMAEHSWEGHASLAYDPMGYHPQHQAGPRWLPPPRPFPGLRQIDIKNMMFRGDVVDNLVTPIMPPQLYYRHNTADDGTYRIPDTRQEPGMMPRSLFDTIVKEYLERLSPKKVDKAVVYFSRYAEVIKLLHHPNACGIGTAQYRYWVKKNFVLAKTRRETRHCDIIVTKGLPVLYVERFYDALVEAHRNMDHAGRDKTDTELKRYWSWMPKEIVADFVRECPTCMEKRPPKAVDPVTGRPIVARKGGQQPRQPSSAGSDSQSDEGRVNMAGKAKSRVDEPDDEAEDEADDEAWNEPDVEAYPDDAPHDRLDSFIMDIDDLQALHTLGRGGDHFAADPGALGAEPDLGGYNFLNDITGFDHQGQVLCRRNFG